ncbi:MAG TPA: MFS transporter, partial [Gemmatimonadaceae bacterium]
MSSSAPPRPTLLTRPMLLLCSASFGAMICFYLLLSVVPQYATSIGATGIGAGLATGALMLSTVALELATPRLVARFGYRITLAAGLALIGAPALALPLAHRMPAILAISLVRGAGLAIIVVVGGSLVASIVPADRRGEGLGLYGFIVNVPAVFGLPAGVWLAAHAGYPTVFVIAGIAGLAGLLAVPGLPALASSDDVPVGVLAGLLTPALARPAVVFSATAMAAGVIVTFLPLAAIHASGNVIALALFLQAAASTLTRWWAGHLGDKHGATALLIPGLLSA